jgi:hypothetical protein
VNLSGRVTIGLKTNGGCSNAKKGLTYVTAIVIVTREISNIIPNRLVFLIIVKINPAIVRFIVSENVVITMVDMSVCSFLGIFVKEPEMKLSTSFVKPVIANTVIITKHSKNAKIYDLLIAQKGLYLLPLLYSGLLIFYMQILFIQ